MVVNAAAALVVIAVARLVSSRSYGEIAQLLGLFFILSMPGSAVLVGVVRRVTGLQTTGQAHLVRGWVARVHRICLVGHRPSSWCWCSPSRAGSPASCACPTARAWS